MRMDTRIPMMGTQPDIIGAMRYGQEARAQADQFAQANALRDYYAQNGAGIMAGENNALAGLAGLDPFAAQTAQSNVLGMQGQRQAQQFLTSEEQRQIEAHAATMSADERAQAREQAVTALAPYAGARNAEEWYSIAKSLNQPELANAYPQRQMLFGRLQDVANVFDTFTAANAPDDPMARIAEEQARTNLDQSRFDLDQARNPPAETPDPQSAIAKLQLDFTNGLITQEQFDLALKNMAPTGTSVVSDGRGGFTITQGAGVGGANGAAINPYDPSEMIANIDAILNDPKLPAATGMDAWRSEVPGPLGARGVGARMDQLQGQAFLQAFQALKGSGQITEIEGDKATAAIARLDRYQSEEEYTAALMDLRSVLEIARTRAPGSVGGVTTPPTTGNRTQSGVTWSIAP